MNKIDMSLDDIIKASKSKREGRKKGHVGSRAGQRRRNGSYRRNASYMRNATGGVMRTKERNSRILRAKYTRTRSDINNALKHVSEGYDYRKTIPSDIVNTAHETTTKLVVSNLDFGVSDLDIQDLFSQFGYIKNSAVHYDKSGRPRGSAYVVFDRTVDAIKAMKQYNGVYLDGKAMDIKLTTQEIPSVYRGGHPRAGDKKKSQVGYRKFLQKSGRAPSQRRNNNRSSNRLIGRGNKGHNGNKNQRNKSRLTVEDLNAELDAYFKKME